MIFFILIAMIVGAACMVLGLLLALFVVGMICGLVSLGLVSASVIVGTWRKSFRKGYKFFLMATGGVAGFICGWAIIYMIDYFLRFGGDRYNAIMAGAAGGLAGGAFTGYLLYRLTGWLVSYFRKKLRIA